MSERADLIASRVLLVVIAVVLGVCIYLENAQ